MTYKHIITFSKVETWGDGFIPHFESSVLCDGQKTGVTVRNDFEGTFTVALYPNIRIRRNSEAEAKLEAVRYINAYGVTGIEFTPNSDKGWRYL